MQIRCGRTDDVGIRFGLIRIRRGKGIKPITMSERPSFGEVVCTSWYNSTNLIEFILSQAPQNSKGNPIARSKPEKIPIDDDASSSWPETRTGRDRLIKNGSGRVGPGHNHFGPRIF
ncbi:hypothetical protein GWI33_012644 [Rhynchophorus ferrugineus]|uniref:Uncharacterized protein n=1 Tax=Rhynchophorus ferrugineus TaxID=354439 RepID=A0A834I503_RHYFE|nr:hypothetical protein GWI33_012644 [Rhynchophorus ferrugineus]